MAPCPILEAEDESIIEIKVEKGENRKNIPEKIQTNSKNILKNDVKNIKMPPKEKDKLHKACIIAVTTDISICQIITF